MSSIQLIERDSLPISSSEFSELQAQASFRSLVRSGVVSIAVGKDGRFRLTASHYLGSATLENGWRLYVQEKAKGTVRGLFAILSNARYRLPEARTWAEGDGAIFLHIAAQFLSSVETYLSRGRVRQYIRQIEETSKPRGRILTRETIKLLARARPTYVAVSLWNLTPDVRVNQILAFCLTEIEFLALQRPEMKPLLSRARRLFMAFQDANFSHLQRLTARERAKELESCISSLRGEQHRPMLECAYPLFVGGGLMGNFSAQFKLPAIFVDMEFLFERACVSVLMHSQTLEYRHRPYSKTPLFQGGSGYTVEPDILLGTDKTSLAVGDVKYKSLGEKEQAGASDVYQLLAHAQAFGVQKAFLVFPGLRPLVRKLGISREGVEVRLFVVRPEHLANDLEDAVLHFCSFLPPVAVAVA